MAGPRDAKFWCQRCREHFHDGLESAGTSASTVGENVCGLSQKFPIADWLRRMQRRELPDGWDKILPSSTADSRSVCHAAESFRKVLNVLAQNIPWLIGGSADWQPRKNQPQV